MTLEKAIAILSQAVAGKTTHNQDFREACQLACATMNAELRRQQEPEQP